MSKTNAKADQIAHELHVAYVMEIETVINYLANSIHLDGLLAKEVRESLKADITEELGHAERLAHRMKILGAEIPGSLTMAPDFNQRTMQPPHENTDVLTVIKGVIDAEESAIKQYQKIVEMSDGVDYVSQDLAIELLGEEEEHRREFVGFLRDWEQHIRH